MGATPAIAAGVLCPPLNLLVGMFVLHKGIVDPQLKFSGVALSR